MEQQNTQQQQNSPPPPKPVYQFRSYWILTPVALGFVLYISRNVRPVINFNTIMDIIGIHDKERFVRLFLLMTVLTVVVLLTKILKK
jgi:hypothetical protein